MQELDITFCHNHAIFVRHIWILKLRKQIRIQRFNSVARNDTEYSSVIPCGILLHVLSRVCRLQAYRKSRFEIHDVSILRNQIIYPWMYPTVEFLDLRFNMFGGRYLMHSLAPKRKHFILFCISLIIMQNLGYIGLIMCDMFS